MDFFCLAIAYVFGIAIIVLTVPIHEFFHLITDRYLLCGKGEIKVVWLKLAVGESSGSVSFGDDFYYDLPAFFKIFEKHETRTRIVGMISGASGGLGVAILYFTITFVFFNFLLASLGGRIVFALLIVIGLRDLIYALVEGKKISKSLIKIY